MVDEERTRPGQCSGMTFLQHFDTAGWVTGKASGPTTVPLIPKAHHPA